MDFQITPLFYSNIFSAGLAFSIAYLMLRSFRVVRRDYLLGFPIGFSFLALSYLFIAASAAFPSLSEVARWSDLFSTTYGFAFIAGTYFLRRRGSVGSFSRWLFSLAILAVLVVVLVEVVPPSWGLSSLRSGCPGFSNCEPRLAWLHLFQFEFGSGTASP